MPAAVRSAADPASTAPREKHRAIDVTGATLCMFGLGGIVFALIEQPHKGWGSPVIFGPLALGVALFAGFLLWERRSAHPMVDLTLFSNRNFSVGNLETASMYAGLGGLIFFLQIFLQQVAGYSALDSGLSTLPLTIIMFLTSRRFGALASRFGPRFFMGDGPIIAAVGIALLARGGLHTPYLTVIFPALLVFALGLAMTVAPLTATVLAAAEERNAGIASAINNAVARVASLVAISCLGLVAAGSLHGDSFSHSHASVHAFHRLIFVCAALVAAGGVAGAIGIVSPPRADPESADSPAEP
jgi:predicted MFS family arabinose efflux permease